MPRRKYSPGFTLIEILIVLLIIGITATFAVLATGDFGASKRIEVAADTLANLLRFAEEQAILEPAVLGVAITDSRYQFYRYRYSTTEHKGAWILITDQRVFKPRSLPSGAQMQLSVADPNQSPALVIDPNGNITPFTLQFGKINQAALYQVSGQRNGAMTLTIVTNKLPRNDSII